MYIIIHIIIIIMYALNRQLFAPDVFLQATEVQVDIEETVRSLRTRAVGREDAGCGWEHRDWVSLIDTQHSVCKEVQPPG